LDAGKQSFAVVDTGQRSINSDLSL